MFLDALSQRLGKPVQEITIGEDRLALILLGDSKGAVLCTLDLSKSRLPVPELYHAEAVIELYFYFQSIGSLIWSIPCLIGQQIA